jgi:hypothetical protein
VNIREITHAGGEVDCGAAVTREVGTQQMALTYQSSRFSSVIGYVLGYFLLTTRPSQPMISLKLRPCSSGTGGSAVEIQGRIDGI